MLDQIALFVAAGALYPGFWKRANGHLADFAHRIEPVKLLLAPDSSWKWPI
jgi:hypothetical protein